MGPDNAVEGWFAKLTRQRLKHGVFTSIVELQTAINRFIADANGKPKPFVWTKSSDAILAAVQRGRQALERFAPDSLVEEEGFEPSVPPNGVASKAGLTIAAKRFSRRITDRACHRHISNLGAELDDAVRRDAEERGRPRRDATRPG
jgi:hypothetical protein